MSFENSKNLKILFICIGNSCRSPMAESILKNMIQPYSKDLNWHIDSAALRSWNIGYSPEERCIQVLNENNLTSDHITRQIEMNDFHTFDIIFGMDESNMHELNQLAPNPSRAKCLLLGSYQSKYEDQIIQDPYFSTGCSEFRKCYEQITSSCHNFVQQQLPAAAAAQK